jgi:hypothetical protein
VPTFADRGCHVVSMTDPYGSILGFLDWIIMIIIIKKIDFLLKGYKPDRLLPFLTTKYELNFVAYEVLIPVTI